MVREIKNWIYYYLMLPLLALLSPGLSRLLINNVILRFNLKFDLQAKRHIVSANFRRVFPDDPQLDRMVDQNIIHDAFLDGATFKFRYSSPSRRKKLIKAEGLENLKEALELGKGAILLTGHTGSFISSVWGIGIHGIPVSLLTNDSPSDVSFPKAYRRFARLTIDTIETLCKRPIVAFPLGRNRNQASSAARRVKALLAENEPVIAALDVPPSLTSSTEKVNFLGEKCVFPSGIIRIAERSGAPIVAYHAAWDQLYSHACTLRFSKPFQLTSDTAENMQKCASIVEEMVRKYPDQWAHWEAFDQFIENDPD